ncbi:hypothetical protein [Paenibacillus sp. FSL R10-2734]|uniref:hypothetical protein n=1 Tax=Paenibacillus sp. FSL R10-2734 TaxID=2954691 RepID=UPI0030DBAD11
MMNTRIRVDELSVRNPAQSTAKSFAKQKILIQKAIDNIFVGEDPLDGLSRRRNQFFPMKKSLDTND